MQINDNTNSQGSISAGAMSRILTGLLNPGGIINSSDTVVLFYDLALTEARISALKRVFPAGTIHAVAIKANPLVKMLTKMQQAGAGAEAASLPEIMLAQQSGFAPEKIVFDSPAKTLGELEYALKAGIMLNADSFAELDRIAELLKTIESKSVIGLRINPQAGTGTIASTSVAGKVSKFGVPLDTNREKIIEYYLRYCWLKAIHVHIGSQGCPVPLLVSGIRKVLDLCLQINDELQKAHLPAISVFDIGGGLPVSYHIDKKAVTADDYAAMLQTVCPELFTGTFRLITEFGRYTYANAGWVAAKVEYVKHEADHSIIVTHAGADMFLRKAYNPADWHHDISVADSRGKLKTGNITRKYIVAGPLCFGGDVIATDVDLPEVEEGDFLLIHDAGAYTLSMWSRYNSRQMPKVVAYNSTNDTVEILKERESAAELIRFWS